MIKVNLHWEMYRKQVTGKDLAKMVGITEQNLSLLRKGRVKGVRFDTLGAICKALDCQPSAILEYVGE